MRQVRLLRLVPQTTPTAGGEFHINRRAYLFANAWALVIAISAVLTSAFYFVNPEALLGTALAHSVPAWTAFTWNICYGWGGLLMIYGLWKPSRPIDILGLSALAAGMLLNAIAILFVRGDQSIASAFVIIAFAIAACMRIALLSGWVNDS
jgi:hypothetical protein